MSCSCACGSNCSCGDNCKCGKRNMDFGSEEIYTTGSLIAGFAPVKTVFEESEMSYGAENGGCGSGCKCGSGCSCASGCKCCK